MSSAVLHDEVVAGMPGTAAGQTWRLLEPGKRDDAEVRRDVLRALRLDILVPLSVDAQVEDGIVTLAGTVSWHAERDDAMFVAACVPGVLGILDEITLIPAQRPADHDDLDDELADALGRTGAADAAGDGM